MFDYFLTYLKQYPITIQNSKFLDQKLKLENLTTQIDGVLGVVQNNKNRSYIERLLSYWEFNTVLTRTADAYLAAYLYFDILKAWWKKVPKVKGVP